jgi:hypothetical protein
VDERELRELRVKRIEMGVRAAETMAQIQTHRRIAILAVSLTAAVSFILAGFSGPFPPITFALAAAALGVVLAQIRALAVDSKNLEVAEATALAAIDSLMVPGGEHDVDASKGDP